MSHATTCFAVILFGVFAPALAQEEESADFALDPRAVAVLPIRDFTTDPSGPGLAVAAYEEILRQLATIDGLHVVEQSLVEPYSDSQLSAKEIGRQLGAGGIVYGSIQTEYSRFSVKLRYRNLQNGTAFGVTSYFRLSDSNQQSRREPDTVLPDAVARLAESLEQSLFPEANPDRLQKSADAEAIFLNTSLSDRERLEALKDLSPPKIRGYSERRIDRGEEVFSEAVVITAAQIATESEDRSVRYGIWSEMVGVRDPYLIQPLLHALANDTDADVRSQVAKTLVDFIDEPGVRDALDYARIHDADEKVRDATHFSMSTVTEQKAELRATALNTSMPERERWIAYFRLSSDYDNTGPFDDELTLAMVTLAQSARDPRTRRIVWWNLSRRGDSSLVEPLLRALNEDTDEHVREAIVQALAEFIEEPGVREALEEVRVDETSPLLMSRAEEVLKFTSR